MFYTWQTNYYILSRDPYISRSSTVNLPFGSFIWACCCGCSLSAQTSLTPRHNIIPVFHRPGPQGNAKNANDPKSAFWCIIYDEIIAKTVEYTNIYIDKVRPQFTRERDARPTDIREMRSLIGILFLAGVTKACRRNVFELWDNSKGLGSEAVYLWTQIDSDSCNVV